MSARDDLYALAVCGDDRTADSRIDAYRAEVRREVLTETTAMACANCCGPIDWINCPTGGWWAHRQHPADGHDASPIPAASLDGDTPPPVGESTQPAIVCICGSTRFMAEMTEADLRETAAGRIVVKPGCNMKVPHPLWDTPEKADALKARLDDLHRAKIRMADEVLVVGDYIGDSTRAEIDYARQLGKPVRFTHPQVDPDRGLPPTGNCTRHTGAERELYGCSGPDPADIPADRFPYLGGAGEAL